MMKWMLSLALALGLTLSASAQTNPVGVWKTIDDETGEARSHVEIYQKDGRLEGKIVRILTDRKEARCEACTDHRKNQPIQGMVIIDGLQAYKDHWRGGTILDPQSGNTYKVSAWFENGNRDELKVRGKHWTGLYRTQTWYRVK